MAARRGISNQMPVLTLIHDHANAIAMVGLTAVLMAWGPMDEQGELRALCKEGSAAGEQGGEDEDDK